MQGKDNPEPEKKNIFTEPINTKDFIRRVRKQYTESTIAHLTNLAKQDQQLSKELQAYLQDNLIPEKSDDYEQIMLFIQMASLNILDTNLSILEMKLKLAKETTNFY